MAAKDSQSTTGITVRDIARRIRRDDEDLEVVVNRLRNWTKEGLLELLGDKHPGSGKTRLYPEYAVVDALVLSALTATGIPAVRAGTSGANSTVLHFGRHAYREFSKREAANETMFLIIFGAERSAIYGADPYRAALAYAKDGRTNARLTAAEGEVVIMVNLSNLLRRLQKRLKELGR